MNSLRLYFEGDWRDGEDSAPVLDKFDASPIGVVHYASKDQVARATRHALQSQQGTPLTPAERARILEDAAALLESRQEAFEEAIVGETGFTRADARREVTRGVQTLKLCASEAARLVGELVPIAGTPGVTGRVAFTLRSPIGLVCAITPFNSPLNTLLHKVGPAIAAGNAVVIKPATATPISAANVVSLLLAAGLPPGYVALLHGDGATVGSCLLEDPLPGFYAFTGSTAVGELIARSIGIRRRQLELGSLASTIICDDADLEDCIGRCRDAAFRKAGQVCTSVQRLYVQDGVLDTVVEQLRADLSSRPGGDPRDPSSYIGPLISEREAERVQEWVDEAVSAGAGVVAGGTREGAVVQPTVLVDVDPRSRVMCEEVFGPVVCIRPFGDLAAAVAEANETPYGLAAGIFTRSLARAMYAAEHLQVGSVHVNETSNGRLDVMPYGGQKASGNGREGPRYAIHEMSEERLLSLRW